MLKVFYGDDRVKAREAIKHLLGADCEVIEAENLTRADMDSVFYGTTLFGDARKILIKSLSENDECWEVLPDYVDTTHDVIIHESSIDKRTAAYKALAKDKRVEFKEFKLAEPVDKNKVFDIFQIAYSNRGKDAVKMCEKIETTNDPYMFMGLMVTQAFKKLELREHKAAKAIKILGDTDMKMKSATVDAWALIKTALLLIADI